MRAWKGRARSSARKPARRCRLPALESAQWFYAATDGGTIRGIAA